jgi:RHS repeat-associated protein
MLCKPGKLLISGSQTNSIRVGSMRTDNHLIIGNPLPAADLGYTGQRQEAELGLYYYVARWYDPAIGRFIQADTIIPNPASAKAFDRYAYAYNNPLYYTDPSGHDPEKPWDPPEKVLVLITLMLLGGAPDYDGIATAEEHVPQGGSIMGVDATAVAAGIAIQSQWYRTCTDTRDGWLSTSSSGLGIAQVGDEEKNALGFAGQNQEDPSIAVLLMAARMNSAMGIMESNFGENFDSQDRFITAALAQNGPGFTPNDVNKWRGPDGSPDWVAYFRSRTNPPSAFTAKVRQQLSGLQFDTQFMLQLFINDTRELYERGWTLPFDLSIEDLDEMQSTYIDGLDLME